MKLLASVRSSALLRSSIITYTHFHTLLSCHCLLLAQSHLQFSPASSSSSSSSCSQSKRHFSTRNNSLFNNSPKSPSHPPESSLSCDIRLLMRRVPHPVAIITTCTSPDSSSTSTSPSNRNPTPRGMTVSSFNTVTLHPKPVISFNVQHPSETLLALQSSARFVVHLLAPSAAAARLARDFARGNQNLELGEFEWEFQPENLLPRLRRRRRQQQQHYQEDKKEGKDFGFVLECRYLPDKTIQVYDHMVVLGSVEKVLSASPRSSDERDDFCLTYGDTRFWKMGEQVE